MITRESLIAIQAGVTPESFTGSICVSQRRIWKNHHVISSLPTRSICAMSASVYTCSTLTPESIWHVTTENKHKICKLFEIIEQQILPLYSLESNDPYIQSAKRYCKILHEFDTDSSRFRYPVDRNCFPYINSIRYYDFVEIGEFLESLCNALDGIYSEIDYRRDTLAQMQAEYAHYC